ncbi:MAG TPA: 4Fe-4S dicluster domain-containing protein [Syntrophomonadaceae bacterium]|nr:4Fe-4S dicluster domain-containing protein [Syntrophomonadaceae bacterium]
MAKVLMIDPGKCISCRTCELACVFKHDREFRPSAARVNVVQFEKEGISVPLMCLQCETAACLKVCPTGALKKNAATGALEVDDDRCIRCKMCINACPFGNATFDAVKNRVLRCDLCGGDPQCAKFCPGGAITYVEATSGTLAKKRAYAAKFKEALEVAK